MKTYKLALIAVFQLFMMSSSCQKSKKVSITECPADIACTAVNVMVSIQITDASGNPVKLDSSYTTRPSTGEVISNHSDITTDGYYVVLGDEYQKKLQQSSDTFVFTGMKDGRIVVTESFVIAADCCHINYKSGNRVVVVQ